MEPKNPIGVTQSQEQEDIVVVKVEKYRKTKNENVSQVKKAGKLAIKQPKKSTITTKAERKTNTKVSSKGDKK